MNSLRSLATFSALLLLVGCAQQATAPTTPEPPPSRPPAEAPPPVERDVVDEPQVFYGDPLDDPNSLLSQRLVYFDFDRSDIRREFNAMLAEHGRYLAARPSLSVRLEGHADERGSREYNIGLGERRAQAVRRVLMLQGVAAAQISTVSYGEERPVVTGHDEASWAQNRRVEIVYRR